MKDLELGMGHIAGGKYNVNGGGALGIWI